MHNFLSGAQDGARQDSRASKNSLTPRAKVFVGMSGGVDSSVAAMLLVEQDFEVVGVYMKNWSEDLPGMKCPWAEDLADAKRVAVKLGIDFEVWDFEQAYREKVVEYMLSEFRKGNTPNPDVMCNQEIKFKLFYEKAMAAGADFIATGHYARTRNYSSDEDVLLGSGVRPTDSRHALAEPALLRAADENKDQTYFLYRISDEALSHTIFPIGEMKKPEVKRLAEEKGLHNAYKKESMGVCFVGEVGMKDFLKEYIDAEPGEIREIESEKVLGYHEGAVFYTIGQRHGLYLSGVVGEVNDGMPYYVVKKDVAKNVVYVSKNLNNEELWTDKLELRDVFLRGQIAEMNGKTTGKYEKPTDRDENSDKKMSEIEVLVRLRHRAPLISAKFDGKTLFFEQKVKRSASGQSAVLYAGEICLGGGIIV